MKYTEKLYFVMTILCIIGMLAMSIYYFPSTPKVRRYIEAEMGVEIKTGAVIHSPSVLLFVNYTEFINLIGDLNATVVYRSEGDYYVFNENMGVGHKYVLGMIDTLNTGRIMRENG